MLGRRLVAGLENLCDVLRASRITDRDDARDAIDELHEPADAMLGAPGLLMNTASLLINYSGGDPTGSSDADIQRISPERARDGLRNETIVVRLKDSNPVRHDL